MTSMTPGARFRSPGLVLVPAVLVLAACADGPLSPGPDAPQAVPAPPAPAAHAVVSSASDGPLLARIRAGTADYHDAAEAADDGFVQASPCVAIPGVGGMGFHYLQPGRVADAAVDPAAPELLLYEPRADGTLRLVGVEFLVVADAWDALNEAPPSLLGETFDEHRGADTHGLPFDHYELHVWTWRRNPAGLTAPFNPTVACDTAF